MLRWFWKQSMGWKVRLIEGWQDCTDAQFIKELKPGGSSIHRSVWVDSVMLLGPHLIVPGQNFLALWKGRHTHKESNGLGKQTQNCHWKHSPNHGLACFWWSPRECLPWPGIRFNSSSWDRIHLPVQGDSPRHSRILAGRRCSIPSAAQGSAK